MKRVMNFFLTVGLFFLTLGVFAQTQNVSGTVTDSNGDPVVAATVRATGTDIGAVTDLDGNFNLKVPSEIQTLTISYVGMTTQIVPITGGFVNVSLIADENLIEGVVVTALGLEREKEAIGYAISQVSGDEITEANPVGFLESLKSNVAGVQVNTASGAAGASTRVVLRGQTTLNGDNQALIVIDGIRMNNSNFSSESSTGGVAYSNRAIDLNPEDIESMTVLKGASAAALYGSQASNGAIIITTKKGSQGKPKFTFNNTFTVGKYSKIVEMQDTYAQGSRGTYDGPESGAAYSWGPAISTLYYDGDQTYKWDPRGRLVTNPNAGPQAKATNNVDNYFEQSFATKNGLSVSGGSELITYRASFDHLNDNGFVPNNKFQRTNASFGSDANFLNNRLHLSNSLQYVNSGGTRIQQGSNVSGVMLGLLRTPISFDNSLGYQFADGTQRNYRGGSGYDNPFWVSNNTPFKDDVNRFLGSFSFGYDLTDWLTATYRMGVDSYSDTRNQIFEKYSRAYPTGRVFDDNYVYRQIDSYLNFGGKVDLGKSNKLDMIYNVGANLYGNKLTNTYVQGDGLNFVGFPSISNTSSISQNSSTSRSRTIAGYGSFEFGYDNLLFITATGRQDYLSNLVAPGEEIKLKDIGIFYPSVSMSFLASELIDSESLSKLKLRSSFAQTGTGAPAPYATSTTFVTAAPSDGWTNGINFPFGGTAGFSLSDTQGNPELVPALTNEFEAGIEIGFLDNRINLDAAYYTRKDENQIIPVPVSDATGFGNSYLNSGALETDGWDVVLGLTPIKNEDFRWDINNTFTTWKTLVTRLADGVNQQFLGGFTGTSVNNVVGQEYGQLFANPYLRNDAGQILIDDNPSSANYGFPLADPIQQAIGNPNPDFILGINNHLDYKNFNFSFLFDIRKGGDVWNGTKGALTTFGRAQITESRGEVRVFDGVKNSTGEANDIAVVVDQTWFTGNGGGFGSVAEPFIEDGSWVRLRNLKLGYSVGRDTWKKSPFDEMEFNVMGNNVALWTKYDGDPEASLLGSGSNGQGLNYFELPNRKTFALGVNFKF